MRGRMRAVTGSSCNWKKMEEQEHARDAATGQSQGGHRWALIPVYPLTRGICLASEIHDNSCCCCQSAFVNDAQ